MQSNSLPGDGYISDRYRIWFSQAQFDLEIAKISLEHKYYEWACYQSIQAVEKALKSVIIHAGWRSPKTHKLGVLLSMCNRANHSFKEVKFNFRKIEVYTFISRYPFIYPGDNLTPHQLINQNDAQTCIDISTSMLSKVESFLSKKAPVHTDKGEIDLENYYFSQDEVVNRVDEVIRILRQSTEIKLEKVILFGSFAREKLHPRSSTMDLLIVANTNLAFIERIQYVREITKDDEPIIEPLVYTTTEFDFMLKDEREGFVESAIDEGRVVFDSSLL